jgi:hypothetical protein
VIVRKSRRWAGVPPVIAGACGLESTTFATGAAEPQAARIDDSVKTPRQPFMVARVERGTVKDTGRPLAVAAVRVYAVVTRTIAGS